MTKRDILDWLRGRDDERLFAKARTALPGPEVYVRGLVEFSNRCCRNCLYCGLRRDNRELSRYRMDGGEILACVAAIATAGIRTVVLQSGDDLACPVSFVCGVIREIKGRFPGMAVTLSVGERRLPDHEAFRRAGADRFLLKHETANPALYARLHPGQRLARRVAILGRLRKLGFQVGSGCIVGLPGQTLGHIAEDILLFRDFRPEMIGIGPFLPHHATPLAKHPAGDIEMSLRVVALARLVAPQGLLPATTAMETRDPARGQTRALLAGANVIMVNFSPEKRRRDYTIYDGKVAVALEAARKNAEAAGRRLSFDRGDAPGGMV